MSGKPITTPAILVGQINYREADRIVKLLTPKLGLVSALARSVRSSRRRFTGILDYGNHVEATIRPGGGELWHLQSTKLVNSRDATRQNFERLTLMTYACEVTAALARADHPEPQLFGLLDMTCLLLDGITTPPPALFRLAFEAKVLTFCGLTPVLNRCLNCSGAIQDSVDESWCFDPLQSAAMHTHCNHGSAHPVETQWLMGIETARKTPLRDTLNVDTPPGPLWMLTALIENHIGRRLRSRKLLDSLITDE